MKSPLTDAQISRALRARLPARADSALRDRILDEAAATPQQRPLPFDVGRVITLRGGTERVRTRRWTLLLVAAAVLALIASAIYVGSRRPSFLAIVPTPGPSASASASASASTPATATPTSSSTAVPTAEVAPATVGAGPHLTWTKVAIDQRYPALAWVGDRFALVDNESGAVFTSVDGVTWHALQPGDPDPGYAELVSGERASWQGDVVGWWNPEDGPDYTNKPPVTARDQIRIVRPSAASSMTTPFKGRIQSLGIGPAGIVAEVHSDLDWDAWVTKKLGARSNNAWVTHLKSVVYRDGILQIKLDNGPGLKVVWAADGRAPGDYQDKGFAWYSPDGEQWTAIAPVRPPLSDDDPTFPMGFGNVVGVSDGFIAQGDADESKPCPSPDGCAGMWYSPDGLTWRNLANVPYGSGSLLPWMGGALVTDGAGRFDTWTSQGLGELPMAAELRAAGSGGGGISAGPLGLVSVRFADRQVLFTQDGAAWSLEPMPAEMPTGLGRALPAGTIAVGDRSVLLLSHEEDSPPSLWLGRLEP